MYKTKLKYLSATGETKTDGNEDVRSPAAPKVDIVLQYTISDKDESGRETMTITVYPASMRSEQGVRKDLSRSHVNEYNSFDLTLDHDKKIAKFFDWDIVLMPELRDFKIGSYVTSELIRWGQKKASEYRVYDLKLSHVDAKDDVSRDLRNNYYSGLNWKLDFTGDPERRNGFAKADSLGQLTPKEQPETIKISSVRSHIHKLASSLDFQSQELSHLQRGVARRDDVRTALLGEVSSLQHNNLLWKLGFIALSLVFLSALFYQIF